MSVRLADRSFQYPVGIAENMLVEVGKFTFSANFIILEMEEDSKVLSNHINVIYEILEEDFNALLEPYFPPVIISSQLSKEKKNKLVSVLKKYKEAFAWKTTDIPGICLSFCKHKIQLLDNKKSIVQKQRRINTNMQEVVKKEIMKLLDTGIIYPIADSPWYSPIHCVPKNGGITVCVCAMGSASEHSVTVAGRQKRILKTGANLCRAAHWVILWFAVDSIGIVSCRISSLYGFDT
ncbi:hypothetical protein Tco_0151312 [Tanacetum coccineum]